jgi:hypothetical protein
MEAFSTSHEWTSSAEASRSRARTSASPAAGPDWPENARVFGGSSQGSLGNYDPATSSLRTSQLSLLEDSTSSLAILPRAGSMRNGTIFLRRPLAPLTGGTASGSLPTPRAQNAEPRNSKPWARPLNEPQNLENWLARHPEPGMWPTPHGMVPKNKRRPGPSGNELGRAVNEAERQWPTPTARLGTARGPQAKRYHDPARSNDLDDAVAATGTLGSLNPEWVGWLMGYPPHWTDTGTESPTSPASPLESPSESTDCEPSGTALSPRSANGSAGRSSSGNG